MSAEPSLWLNRENNEVNENQQNESLCHNFNEESENRQNLWLHDDYDQQTEDSEIWFDVSLQIFL